MPQQDFRCIYKIEENSHMQVGPLSVLHSTTTIIILCMAGGNSHLVMNLVDLQVTKVTLLQLPNTYFCPISCVVIGVCVMRQQQIQNVCMGHCREEGLQASRCDRGF